MINWHNCPNWEYQGYSYSVEIDEDPDDGTRKAWHLVYKDGKQVATLDHTPYQFLTRDEFTYHIDMLFFDPYDYSEKQGALS